MPGGPYAQYMFGREIGDLAEAQRTQMTTFVKSIPTWNAYNWSYNMTTLGLTIGSGYAGTLLMPKISFRFPAAVAETEIAAAKGGMMTVGR